VFSVRTLDTPRKRGTRDEREMYRTIAFGFNQQLKGAYSHATRLSNFAPILCRNYSNFAGWVSEA
jgi:hypothetical protein